MPQCHVCARVPQGHMHSSQKIYFYCVSMMHVFKEYFVLILKNWWGWRDGSVVRITVYSMGPRFSSSTQLPVTPDPEDLVPSSGLLGH